MVVTKGVDKQVKADGTKRRSVGRLHKKGPPEFTGEPQGMANVWMGEPPTPELAPGGTSEVRRDLNGGTLSLILALDLTLTVTSVILGSVAGEGGWEARTCQR